MDFVCPVCRQPVEQFPQHYECFNCRLEFPVVAGIPDFRIFPDPYIGLDDDRAKALRLFERASSLGFKGLLRHYYSITPEVPVNLAERWTAHAKAEPLIAGGVLKAAGFDQSTNRWLDIGCGSGGLLVAAGSSASELVGVDVALRWLVIARVRLAEASVKALLVCANAEALPFPDAVFSRATAIDLLEHVRDAARAVGECRRVLSIGASCLWCTNNRYAILPEPHTGLWWVSWLPKHWQAGYVAFRRPAMHRYRVCLRSRREIAKLFREAGFSNVLTAPAPLFAPQRKSLATVLRVYNRFRTLPIIGWLMAALGPRLQARAER